MKEKQFSKKRKLLAEILYCLNQLPNQKVNSGYFKNTYDICTEINRHLKRDPVPPGEEIIGEADDE